ncbi:L-type lectin-domain containing receptor kinase IX.1-like [Rutidosis leptorrhynchoides]|uniref:L-type lectin-domain containing receptor kinase IX.1-like n=1 Tax=Rutidosis leptorrhynchoides TaxID=125765 RepID=UPI003A99C478
MLRSYISDGGIQLTSDAFSARRTGQAGRAIYTSLLRLWDNTSGELASFSTNFTFAIDLKGSTEYGDGIAFFLAENNSVTTPGGAVGLPIDPTNLEASNQFVAIKFDTYWNDVDPPFSGNNSKLDFVGININSIASAAYQLWLSNIIGVGECQAWINYDSVSKNLSVSFTGFLNTTIVCQDGLSYTVDLRRELPEWVIFGFVGSSGDRFEINKVKSWSFNSSDLEVNETNTIPPTLGQNPGSNPGQNTGPDTSSGKSIKKMGIIIGISVTFVIVFIVAFVFWSLKKSMEYEISFDNEMNNEFEMGTGPKIFSYNEVARSTSDFAENEKLGDGGFGGVYRGYFRESSTYVAVKRVSKNSKQGIKEYASEFKIISRLRHRNLVQLTGWCHEKGELLLVYEYMENGSLDSHLFKEKSLLKWGTRYKIVHGLASALLYLHEEWEQCVLHRDIKSSNVMLDLNFNAKLGDFGLAKMVDHEKGSETTMLAGTLGYMAPEYVETGKASKESDVYRFGVVTLEIACGRKTIKRKAPEKQMRLLEWVWDLYGSEALLEAVDPRLGSEFEEDEVEHLMIVGLWCVHPDSEVRPSMRQVIQVLKHEASLPILPSKMPVASYLIPSMAENQSYKIVSNIDSSNLKGYGISYPFVTDISLSMRHG